MNQPPSDLPQLRHIDRMSDLLDSRFRIPGTDARFGVDFLIGLVPYAGDVISFGFSGLLILAMARHGASGRLVARMLWNVLLDTVVGAVPVLGDIFDLYYKANRRNYHLLAEHYGEGAHQGSAWPVVIGVVMVLLMLLVALIVFLFWLAGAVWDLLVGVL